MSEPAAVPQPEPGKYEWREPRDMNCDVLALVACGVLGDRDGAVTILASLDDQQTTAACWAVVLWLAGGARAAVRRSCRRGAAARARPRAWTRGGGVSSREEREWLTGDLEVRGLIPSPAQRAAIRAAAEEVARRVTRRRRVTAHEAVIILLEQRELSDG